MEPNRCAHSDKSSKTTLMALTEFLVTVGKVALGWRCLPPLTRREDHDRSYRWAKNVSKVTLINCDVHWYFCALGVRIDAQIFANGMDEALKQVLWRVDGREAPKVC